MSNQKSKLELTWIGKDSCPRLEPRILLEETTLSYGVRASGTHDIARDNLLIQGDNLLALKALQHDYAGRVKCIYIDPPFNTRQAFEHYDDGVEHSVWLTLMRDRLALLQSLLTTDGTIFVHIDDNELAYLTVLMDELFGRRNRLYVITFKQGSATGHKAINPGCVTTSNFILMYAKERDEWRPSRVYTSRDRDTRYSQFIENVDDDFSRWKLCTLTKGFARSLGSTEKEARSIARGQPEKLDTFVTINAKSVVRLAVPSYDDVSKAARSLIDKSKESPGKVLRLRRDDHSDMYLLGGQRILFYSDKLKLVDGEYVAGEPLTTIWDDILSNNLHNEGGVDFPKGKKPEALIKRALELTTKQGDIVLDSFGGSGTTAAVAHKMHRQWITVERGDHAITHILPRLKSVIDGKETSGITEAVGWDGGGGFRFMRLAASLLERDKWGNWIINKCYNREMLAEAMCKLEGFRYAPSQTVFWQHGQSTERDFIYVTTQTLNHEQLAAISVEVGSEMSLLICCSAFKAKIESLPNLTVKKIPAAVLARCEWGRDDYSLNVQNVMGEEPPDTKAIPITGLSKGPTRRKRRSVSVQELSLFTKRGEE